MLIKIQNAVWDNAECGVLEMGQDMIIGGWKENLHMKLHYAQQFLHNIFFCKKKEICRTESYLESLTRRNNFVF